MPLTTDQQKKEAKIDGFVANFVKKDCAPKGEANFVDGFGFLRTVSRGGRDVPRPPGTIRLVIVSDTHEKHEMLDMPPGDVLVHCGDSFMLNQHYSQETSRQKLQTFNAWLSRLPYREKVVIGGNHDAALQAMGRDAVRQALPSAIYLENEAAVLPISGLRVFGSPTSVPNSERSQNRAFQAGLDGMDDLFATAVAPSSVDLLVMHGPPHLIPAAKKYIEQQAQTPGSSLACVAWGHVHELHGSSLLGRREGDSSAGGVVGINASTMGATFGPTNAPVLFDIRINSPETGESDATDEEGVGEKAVGRPGNARL